MGTIENKRKQRLQTRRILTLEREKKREGFSIKTKSNKRLTIEPKMHKNKMLEGPYMVR